jgi:uncharacterized protein YhbP (UPF0306 family)
VSIERSARPVASARITTVARNLLEASNLCAIATVSHQGRAHINTAYFAFNRAFELVWLSDPHARHSAHIRTTATVAIAVYDSHQTWGTSDRGIQLFGSARESKGQNARKSGVIYARRFPGYREADFSSYRLYRFKPQRMKLFDEEGLGAGVFVTARVGPDGTVAWERSEVFRASG